MYGFAKSSEAPEPRSRSAFICANMPVMLLRLILCAAPLWPAPQSTRIEGCQAAACTERASQKICKCVPIAEGEDARPGVVIEGPGARHLEWDVRSLLGEVNDFSVQTTDLDGDSKPELLIASRASESNGMMVRDWEIAIVDGETDGVMHLLVQDWGPDALSAQGTLLLTEWALSAGQIVFTGREYRYESGRLEPADVPVRRRSLNAAFEKERLAAIKNSPNRMLSPRAFLNHASTKQGADVVPKLASVSLVKGVAREEPWLQLHLQGSNGKVEMLSGDVEGKATLRLGDVKRKRLFPLGYAPADAETWLIGRNVWRADGQVWIN
jgi:hypothetical protein